MGSITSKGTRNPKTTVPQLTQQSVFPFSVPACPVINLNASSYECGLFSNLPKELLLEFSKWISDRDILMLAITCKTIHDLVSDDTFWTQLLAYRDTQLFDDNYSQTQFSKLKYWYFFQRNNSNIKIVKKEDIPIDFIVRQKKAVFVGPTATGKTQITRSLCNVDLDSSYKSTIGVDFIISYWHFKESYYRMQIWDSAGNSRLRFVTASYEMLASKLTSTSYYRSSHVVIMVYSVTNRDSFKQMDHLFDTVMQHTGLFRTIVLVANFQDVDKEQHQVTSEEGQIWAKKRNPTEHNGELVSVLFLEVSAKSQKGIQMLRKVIAEAYMHSQEKSD